MLEYTSQENSTSILRDKTLTSLKKYKKMYPCEANLIIDKGGKKHY